MRQDSPVLFGMALNTAVKAAKSLGSVFGNEIVLVARPARPDQGPFAGIFQGFFRKRKKERWITSLRNCQRNSAPMVIRRTEPSFTRTTWCRAIRFLFPVTASSFLMKMV